MDKVKQEIIMLSNIIVPLSKKKVATSEKVTPSEEVEKGTKTLDDIKDSVVKIFRKDLFNFQGQSTISTCWFNLDPGWLREKFSTLEPDFCTNIF